MKQCRFDVVVVGGGHAGCEAALAAHRRGARTALVTHRFDRIGEMSCNPAIGGVGKGHIVREIDALDGVMGWAADQAGIQYRLLNRRKGPAAHGPRVQADRTAYRNAVQSAFLARPEIAVICDEVVDLKLQNAAICGVVLARGGPLACPSVVLATGTFLRGCIYVGSERRSAGRAGDPAASRIADCLRDLGLPLARLKTGTPPRLEGRSIDWEKLERQEGDVKPELLSFLSRKPRLRQVSCSIAHTNPRTHAIVHANIGSSAMYGDRLAGRGPRYCPSLEDKVIKFPDKAAHQVFLEPEGLDDTTVYPNGLSTSLDPGAQDEVIRSIIGLKNCRILRPGYAIEYDYVDPRSLSSTLAVKQTKGLYFAGQINGTTGYEEAAGQGLIAGLNAASFVMGIEPIVLDRAHAFIGVMIDDLVTKGVTEPYRMFTSRAEYRLQMRADNADRRLTSIGIALGIISEQRQAAFKQKMHALRAANDVAEGLVITSTQCEELGIGARCRGQVVYLKDAFPDPLLKTAALASHFPAELNVSSDVLDQVVRDAIYAPYVAREVAAVARLRRDEEVALPASLEYSALPGLSAELKEKLGVVRPQSLGQAARIEGMTPAALTLILLQCREMGRMGS